MVPLGTLQSDLVLTCAYQCVCLFLESYPSSLANQSSAWGPFVTTPVLGRPPLRNLICHWLTSHPLRAKQGEVKEVRGGTPTRKISFVSLVAYGPKVSHSDLAIAVCSF